MGPVGAGIAEAITGIVEEIAGPPQSMVAAERSMLNASTPFMNFASHSLAMGRASADTVGGYGGDFGTLGPGDAFSSLPPWMRATGLGPNEAMDMLSKFGIVGVPSEQEGMARALSTFDYLPGTSMLGHIYFKHYMNLELVSFIFQCRHSKLYFSFFYSCFVRFSFTF